MTRPQIMGIVNVTPDSFSDGGQWFDTDDAIAHGVALFEAGASIIDVGGESTRPGAQRVDPDEEARRVLPVVSALVERGIPVSVDTLNASTALAAVEAGADLVNDVSGGLADPNMGRVIAETGVHFVVAHWPGSADARPEYLDVVGDVRAALKTRIAELIVVGVAPDKIVLDPGLGFGKRGAQNWEILRRIDEIANLGHALVLGASRKHFVAELLPGGHAMTDRDFPTAVIGALAAQAGVWAVRVHDVASTRLALDVWSAWTGDPDWPGPVTEVPTPVDETSATDGVAADVGDEGDGGEDDATDEGDAIDDHDARDDDPDGEVKGNDAERPDGLSA